MVNDEFANRTKQDIIRDWMHKRPYLEEIGKLNIFAADCLDTVPLPTTTMPGLNPYERDFAKGIALLRQPEVVKSMLAPAGVVLAAFLPLFLAGPINEALRSYGEALYRYVSLPITVDRGVLGDSSFGDASISRSATIISLIIAADEKEYFRFCKDHDLQPQFIRSVGWLVLRQVLRMHQGQLRRWRQNRAWHQTYCPVCGAPAMLAHLQNDQDSDEAIPLQQRMADQGRQRSLVCTQCHTEWEYKRLGCVHCGNDDLRYLHILEANDAPNMRVDVCDRCHHYIKTYLYNGREKLFFTDWASLHMDLLAEGHGFLPPNPPKLIG